MVNIRKISLVLMIIIMLSGCNSFKSYNVYEKVYETYNNMNSYSAKVEVVSFSNNSENKYTLTQFFKMPHKQRSEFLSETAGNNITIINDGKGKIISEYATNPVLLDSVDIEEKDYLMLNTFFDIYYSSEETSVKTSGNETKGTITLSAETGSSAPHRKKMELIIDTKTLIPKKMTVLNDKDKPTLEIKYLEFELNPELEDKIFE